MSLGAMFGCLGDAGILEWIGQTMSSIPDHEVQLLLHLVDVVLLGWLNNPIKAGWEVNLARN